ncbi:MAG: lysophospholipid acyltransferase family protein [Planctomycetota bacterium]
MSVVLWVILAVAVWLLISLFVRWLLDNPRQDLTTGLACRGFLIYGRLVHRLRVEGREHIPTSRHPGPLIVVANHTAGVDPLLLQGVCPFEIRWMMAEDMRAKGLEWFWSFSRIIFVDRQGQRDMLAAREAIRHVKAGGVLGIFPEGGIERPPRELMPFQRGVGLIISKTGAPVLPVVIDGTPQVDPAWASLWRRSSSRIRVGEPIDYASSGMKPREYADDLRRRFAEWTGWPLNESPEPPPAEGKGAGTREVEAA